MNPKRIIFVLLLLIFNTVFSADLYEITTKKENLRLAPLPSGRGGKKIGWTKDGVKIYVFGKDGNKLHAKLPAWIWEKSISKNGIITADKESIRDKPLPSGRGGTLWGKIYKGAKVEKFEKEGNKWHCLIDVWVYEPSTKLIKKDVKIPGMKEEKKEEKPEMTKKEEKVEEPKEELSKEAKLIKMISDSLPKEFNESVVLATKKADTDVDLVPMSENINAGIDIKEFKEYFPYHTDTEYIYRNNNARMDIKVKYEELKSDDTMVRVVLCKRMKSDSYIISESKYYIYPDRIVKYIGDKEYKVLVQEPIIENTKWVSEMGIVNVFTGYEDIKYDTQEYKACVRMESYKFDIPEKKIITWYAKNVGVVKVDEIEKLIKQDLK